MVLWLLMLAAGMSPVVPTGPGVLVNGFLGADEWRGALRLPLDPQVELLVRQDGRYLYLAVVFKDTRHTGVDLHLTTRDGRAVLHVSSALGERAIEDTHSSGTGAVSAMEDTHPSDARTVKGSDPAATRDTRSSGLVWGRNRWWVANTVCVTVEEGKQVVIAPEAFEFQLDRARLDREVALFFHLKRPEKKLPAEASPEDPDRWLRLRLEN